jgi:Rieske Fe-S protein
MNADDQVGLTASEGFDTNSFSRRHVVVRAMMGAASFALLGVIGTVTSLIVRSAPERVRVLISRKAVEPTGGLPFMSNDDPTENFFVVPYPAESLGQAAKVYPEPVVEGMRAGFVALSRKCPHQGHRLNWCEERGVFSCESHGGTFTAVGEKLQGPSSAGMTLLLLLPSAGADSDDVAVFPEVSFPGVPPGTNTTNQELPQGTTCDTSAWR